jgi:hypothetical protein
VGGVLEPLYVNEKLLTPVASVVAAADSGAPL